MTRYFNIAPLAPDSSSTSGTPLVSHTPVRSPSTVMEASKQYGYREGSFGKEKVFLMMRWGWRASKVIDVGVKEDT